MPAAWAMEEMDQAIFEDERLNARLTKLLSDLGERPQLSIPAACGGHAETAAAYRFFDNESVTQDLVLQPHFEKTRERMSEHSVVLLVQDTTELDFTRPHQQVAGAGPLKDASQRGALLHPLEAFTPDGTPLGAVWAQMWSAKMKGHHCRGSRSGGCGGRRRWKPRRAFVGCKDSAAREVAQQVPQTTCVCLGDSESDIYELFLEPRRNAGPLADSGGSGSSHRPS